MQNKKLDNELKNKLSQVPRLLKDVKYDYLFSKTPTEYNNLLRKSIVYLVSDLMKESNCYELQRRREQVLKDFNITVLTVGEVLQYLNIIEEYSVDIEKRKDYGYAKISND